MYYKSTSTAPKINSPVEGVEQLMNEVLACYMAIK